LKVNNIQERLCRQIEFGGSIHDPNCRICRLVKGHNPNHVFTPLYNDDEPFDDECDDL